MPRAKRQQRLTSAELVARAYQEAGVDLTPGRDPHNLTPAHLHDTLPVAHPTGPRQPLPQRRWWQRRSAP